MASYESDEELESWNDGHNNDIHSATPGSSSRLKPSGYGYSVKSPRQKKRASLLRAQQQADNMPSPREVKRQNLMSQKTEQPLGGTGDPVGSEVDLREHRIKHLRRKQREEQGKKIAKSAAFKSSMEERARGHMASLTVEENKESTYLGPQAASNKKIFSLAKGRALYALDTAVDEVGQTERTNLLALTLRKLLLNARNDPSKRLLKLSNGLLWERVAQHYCGRAVLNAAGFELIKSGEEGQSTKFGHHIQPLDAMEKNLKILGNENSIMTVQDNINLDLINGALDAVNSFLSNPHSAGQISSHGSQKTR